MKKSEAVDAVDTSRAPARALMVDADDARMRQTIG